MLKHACTTQAAHIFDNIFLVVNTHFLFLQLKFYECYDSAVSVLCMPIFNHQIHVCIAFVLVVYMLCDPACIHAVLGMYMSVGYVLIILQS